MQLGSSADGVARGQLGKSEVRQHGAVDDRSQLLSASAFVGDPRLAGVMPIHEVLAVLWRRKRLVLSIACLGATVGLMMGLSRVPQYTAEASVMLDTRQSNIVNVDPVTPSDYGQNGAVETEINLIKSLSHVEAVVESLGLIQDPEFNVALTNSDPPTVEMVLDESWRTLVGWVPEDWLVATGLAKEGLMPAEHAEPAYDWSRDATVGAFLRRLGVTQQGDSSVIRIQFSSSSPQKAAKIANRTATLYVEDRLEQERSAVGKGTAWLEARLESLQDEVRQAEDAVEAYRTEHNLVDGASFNLSDQELSKYNSELISARAELAQRRARLKMIEELRLNGDSLEGIPEVVGSPIYLELWSKETELASARAELASTYGTRHPQMAAVDSDMANVRRQMDFEIDRIVQRIEDQAEILERRIALLEGELDRVKDANADSRRAAVRLRELERQAVATRTLHQSYLERYKEIERQSEIVEPDVRLIAEARPPTAPSSADPKLFALVGFTFSSMAGVFLALLLERSDRAVRSTKQIESLLGLPCLSQVPELKPKLLRRGRRPHEYILDRPSSAYAETIRLVHASLGMTADGSRPRVIQVTSSVPEEGKTTLAVSLATVIAQGGARVVILDLDLHRASVAREFKALKDVETKNERDEGALPSAIRDPASHLDVLSFKGSGFSPHRLLPSQRMHELIQLMRESYDFVIVDGPPALGMSDTKMITRLVDAVVIAVRWGKTTVDLVGDAKKELQSIDATIAGAVITRVDFDKQARYRYGGIDSYYATYRKYYAD